MNLLHSDENVLLDHQTINIRCSLVSGGPFLLLTGQFAIKGIFLPFFLISPEFIWKPDSPQLSAGWSSSRSQLHLWGINEGGVHLWRINTSIKFYWCTVWSHAMEERDAWWSFNAFTGGIFCLAFFTTACGWRSGCSEENIQRSRHGSADG